MKDTYPMYVQFSRYSLLIIDIFTSIIFNSICPIGSDRFIFIIRTYQGLFHRREYSFGSVIRMNKFHRYHYHITSYVCFAFLARWRTYILLISNQNTYTTPHSNPNRNRQRQKHGYLHRTHVLMFITPLLPSILKLSGGVRVHLVLVPSPFPHHSVGL